MAVLNETIEIALRHYSAQTAKCFQNDVLSFMGGIKQEYIGPLIRKIPSNTIYQYI